MKEGRSAGSVGGIKEGTLQVQTAVHDMKIVTTGDNLFSPNGQPMVHDFDLAQYNSPSFAAA